MRENVLQQKIRLACGALPGVVLWRNNVGIANYNGTRVRYGLAPGSSDLIGIVDGRFVALELKAGRGRVTPEQEDFLKLVLRMGGYAQVVRSVDTALEAIDEARRL